VRPSQDGARPRLPAAVAAALLLAAAGCHAGYIEGDRFNHEEGAYSVPLPPPPWKVVWIDAAQLTLVHPERGATMGVNRTCKRLRTDKLEVLTRELYVGIENKDWRTLEPRELPAGDAMYAELDGTADDKRVRMASYVLVANGCLLDIAYVGAPGAFDAERPAFEAVARGLRVP